MSFLERIHDFFIAFLNVVLFRKSRSEKLQGKFLKCIASDAADDVLYLMLNLMSLILCLDKDYRRNIKNFNATYQFTDQKGDIMVAAIFKNNKLKVTDKKMPSPTVTLIFQDGKSLFKFLLSGSPDILNALLNQEIDFSGNINYINKFAFMAIHLVLAPTGEAIL